jgi:hypothetical protein
MLREKRLLRGEITAIQGNVVDSGRVHKVCSQDANIAPKHNRPINRRRRGGIVPQNAAGLVNTIQTHLASFGPATEGQKTLHAEAYRVAHYHRRNHRIFRVAMTHFSRIPIATLLPWKNSTGPVAVI